MKKWMSLLLAAILLFSLAACGDQKKNDKKTADDATEATVSAEPSEATETDAPTDPAEPGETDPPTESGGDVLTIEYIRGFDKTPSLSEQVVYDDGGMTLKVKGLVYDPITGVKIPVSVTNNNEESYLVQTGYFTVNGFMIDAEFSVSVPAKKTVESEILLTYQELAIADIKSVREMLFSIRVMDEESFEVTADSGLLELRTSAATDDALEYDESGQVAYDAKKVKIILRGINTGRMFSEGDALMVYMVNATDKLITIQTESVVVNGYDITSAMTATILPGMHAVDIVTFYALEMDEYGIEEIDTVDVSFKIMDETTWKTIAKTKTISVEL